MHIAELWRYPVASLAGEPLTHARLDEGGVSGDRRFSIVCKTTGTVASPESAAHWQGAPLVAARGSGLDLCIKTPSTDWLPAFGVAAASALNEHFGFEVEIRTTGRWRGEPPQSKRIQPRYNRQPLHLITTRSLNLLAEALPSEPVNAQRFRANLVLDMSQDEESEMMREGTAVSFGRPDIRILGPTGRCAFVALAQNKLAGAPKLLRQIKQEHLIVGHDNFPVYVDSPLAVDATHVFSQNLDECYDDETRAIVDKGINPISFRGLNLAITLEESKAINFDETPKVIISASGMCDAGRIRHHIKYNLWRPESTIVFAGYQAEGTLGRALMDGADHVKLFGEEVAVKAEIAQMADMSSHADQFGLMNWIRAYEQAPDRVFLVHGNDDGMEVLSKLIEDELHYTVNCPYSGSVFDLLKNEWETVAEPKKIEKPTYALVEDGSSKRKKTSDAAYDRLLAAYTKLSAAVKANYGGANNDLARFTNQLLSLYDKWIR